MPSFAQRKARAFTAAHPDPIVYQLQEHDRHAKSVYSQTASRYFEHYIAWENLTTAEQDYWRTHVE